MKWAPLWLLLCACGHVNERPEQGELHGPLAQAQVVLQAFLSAAETGHFEEARQLLVAPLRARYSTERLALDFAREPLARQRVAKIKASSAALVMRSETEVVLPWAEGRQVALIREDEGWRVASLE